MTYVGIDIEQFARDPYGSGIQRVLQYLAREWPGASVQADFVVPVGSEFALLAPAQAADLLTIPFTPQPTGSDLRALVSDAIAAMDAPRVKAGDLVAMYDAWLLPEVSYLPSVLGRFETMTRCLPTVMIGYDTLPMSEPANYRFKPGTAAFVSEYFRLLSTADSVVCISAYARDSILGRLRRDPRLPISVAHPGGDHLAVRERAVREPAAGAATVVFTRLGTLEARKRPVEILRAFQDARAAGMSDAELVFIGGPSASDESINVAVQEAVDAGEPVRWIRGASDADVHDLVHASTVFLSIGTEGYGIPVLEAIRLGTPVLFDGVQPAGDLMVGRGARRVPAMQHEDLSRLFLDHARPGALDSLTVEADPRLVPTWADFASAIALACAEA